MYQINIIQVVKKKKTKLCSKKYKKNKNVHEIAIETFQKRKKDKKNENEIVTYALSRIYFYLV